MPLAQFPDFRPSQVLIVKTLSCVNSYCPACTGSITGCCPACQVERLILIEDLADNQLLAQAFARLVHLDVERRGYFVQRPLVTQGCCNRQIRLGKTLLQAFLAHYQDLYRGVVGPALLPSRGVPTPQRHQALVSRLEYLVDLAAHSTRSTVYAVLISNPV